MVVDAIIVIFLIIAVLRGFEIGFIQQLFSTIGFFGGLLIGASLEPHTVNLVHTELSRTLVTILTTLGCAFILLTVSELLGAIVKRKIRPHFLDRLDSGFGSLIGVVTLLGAVWLSAVVIQSLPQPGLQQAVRQSRIVSALSDHLPDAPNLIASLGHLIDPNGFPQVFSGAEPNAPAHVNLPPASQIAAAVNRDRASVVKLVGQGCGGIVEGSGFVAGDNLVITDAHVVAGISKPYVVDANGTHSATAIWFDPNLDLAILRVSNLAGQPLVLNNNGVSANTPAAVIGYPGGGSFTANPASVIEEFNAVGRDIYGRGSTERDVYEVASNIQPGNSGGPLIMPDGSVVGVVFAKSTSYNNIGYALALSSVVSALNQAAARNTTVSTGSCAQ